MSLRKRLIPIVLASFGIAGLGACSDDDPVQVQSPPASAVTNLDAAVTGQQATISWSAVTGATGYTVTLSTSGENDRTQTTAETSATFTGLTEGKDYTAVVTPTNDAGSGPTATLSFSVESDVVEVVDDILENTTWTSDKVYLLRGAIFVGRDIDGTNGVSATLTIEPGTTILGDVNPPQGARGSFLVVSRGSRIVADANAGRADPTARPNPEDVIVFTSSADRGSRVRGDWGGLVINGRAPTNAGTDAEGEGESGLYGGTDPDDDSGILRGVRVEFAGDRVTATDELNGIAFQGVGAGTTVDYVQVHYNVDDGTEPFGGTVSQTHMVMTGIGDDSFDGTDGYRGFIQFAIAQQRADNADQGFEFSNNGDDESAAPHSTAIVANVTLVGARVDALGTGEIQALGNESDIGILLREGAGWRVFNSIATGFGRAGFCVEGAVAAANADRWLAGESDPDLTLRTEGTIVWSNGEGAATADADDNFASCSTDGYTTQENEDFFLAAAHNNMLADPNLPDAAFSVGSMSSPPDFVPTAMPSGYAAATFADITAGLIMPIDGRTLVATDYAGAIAPGTAVADAWYAGWTVWSTDGSDSRPGLGEL